MQLQELLSQVLDPEVDCACIEVLQEQHCTGKDANADDVEQLVAFQAAAAFPAQLSSQAADSTCKAQWEKSESCLQQQGTGHSHDDE